MLRLAIAVLLLVACGCASPGWDGAAEAAPRWPLREGERLLGRWDALLVGEGRRVVYHLAWAADEEGYAMYAERDGAGALERWPLAREGRRFAAEGTEGVWFVVDEEGWLLVQGKDPCCPTPFRIAVGEPLVETVLP